MSAATQTIAESPTALSAAQLEAIAENFGHMNEITPHLAAAQVGGYELPPEALDLVAKALHLQRLYELNVRPPDHHDTDCGRLLSGASTDDVLNADDAAAFAKSRWERSGSLLIAARGKLAGQEAGVFKAERDGLITGPLRHTMAAVLKEAKTAAGKLEKFAPDYPPSLLESANQAELTVWRHSRQLQRDFDVLVRAWKTSWYRATRHGTGVLELHFYTQKAGGWFCWQDPEAVVDPELRYGRDAEVLRVATAGSSFQLVAPCEFHPMLDALQATFPPDHMAAWQVVRANMCVSGA